MACQQDGRPTRLYRIPFTETAKSPWGVGIRRRDNFCKWARHLKVQSKKRQTLRNFGLSFILVGLI